MFWLLLLLLPVVIGILSQLPDITIDTASVVTSTAYTYVRAACYFIPVHTIVTILGIILGLWIFRVIISLVRTIWDMLPIG